MTSANPADAVESAGQHVPGLFQRGSDGLWIGKVALPDDGSGRRRYRQVASKDRDTAVERLAQLRDDVAAGRIAAACPYTVESWLTHWMDEIHAAIVRPTTRRSYESKIRHHVLPHIGSRRLDRLTRDDIRRMHRRASSTAAARAAHQIIRRALQDAVREGVIDRNVADAVHEPRHTTVVRDALTAEQAQHLIDTLTRWKHPGLLRVACALQLGARQGEVLGMTWDHVDLDNKMIDLAWQLQSLPALHGCNPTGEPTCGYRRGSYCPAMTLQVPRGFEHHVLHRTLALTRPKTVSGSRIVPIVDSLHHLFTTAAAAPRTRHNLVFHHDGQPISAAADAKAWHEALRLADLPPVALHSARATCNTALMEAGVDQDIRMAILGHVSVADHRLYARINPAMKSTAMTHVNRFGGPQ